MARRRVLIWFLLLFPLVAGVFAHELAARFGGGGGYSGGGGGGGGSGGGGGGDGIGALIYLLFRLFLLLWDAGPVGKVLAILLLVGAIGGFIWRANLKKAELQKLNAQGRILHSNAAQRRQSQGISLIRQFDPNFSRVLFLDFARLVYVKLHESRGGLARRNNEFAVAPYISPQIREQVKQARVSVSEVVVGDVQVGAVTAHTDSMHVVVKFNANVVESVDGQKPTRFYLEQRLTFARPKTAITQPPEKVLSLGCPNCGSPAEPDLQGRCPSCGSVTGRGEMDWQVKRIETARRERVGPPIGHKGGIEVGTNDPTIFSSDLSAQKRSLAMRDAGFSWVGFNSRANFIFRQLQQAWMDQDEPSIRPFVTDTLYDTVRYWFARYRDQGVREVLEDVKVQRIEVARIEHDAWFDAITVRIFASMKEYQLKDGRVLSGNKDKPRHFSEYWTLIRRSDVAHKQSADPASCPNCGAPLDKISRLGVCGYCNSRIVSGDFDWVLAMITQDEDYTA